MLPLRKILLINMTIVIFIINNFLPYLKLHIIMNLAYKYANENVSTKSP